jgi:hypothetical protein
MSQGLVADANAFRGWWVATGMAGAMAGLVLLLMSHAPKPAQTEAATNFPPGPHLHQESNGGWAPDPGCSWASNDPENFHVVCKYK